MGCADGQTGAAKSNTQRTDHGHAIFQGWHPSHNCVTGLHGQAAGYQHLGGAQNLPDRKAVQLSRHLSHLRPCESALLVPTSIHGLYPFCTLFTLSASRSSLFRQDGQVLSQGIAFIFHCCQEWCPGNTHASCGFGSRLTQCTAGGCWRWSGRSRCDHHIRKSRRL